MSQLAMDTDALSRMVRFKLRLLALLSRPNQPLEVEVMTALEAI
jgi:hypothetical protein